MRLLRTMSLHPVVVWNAREPTRRHGSTVANDDKVPAALSIAEPAITATQAEQPTTETRFPVQ
ncbi:hypothetical protein [Maioricimonas rarisocia]|uniref:hypothetical protein n=1 Tax=Maioricimonas rarisocia TaxID=2528026 RepID=UPI0011A97B89|nr:hypothetical protein [Maioricimonas rarisocia]